MTKKSINWNIGLILIKFSVLTEGGLKWGEESISRICSLVVSVYSRLPSQVIK